MPSSSDGSISGIDPDMIDLKIIEGEMPDEEKRQILDQIGVLTDDDLSVNFEEAVNDKTLTVRYYASLDELKIFSGF